VEPIGFRNAHYFSGYGGLLHRLEKLNIDGILEWRIQEKPATMSGPLLLGMSAAAKFLGVSRGTLWRMIKGGMLPKIEILPGTFPIRRADLVAIAAGQKKIELQ
jgi:hypothetical protein